MVDQAAAEAALSAVVVALRDLATSVEAVLGAPDDGEHRCVMPANAKPLQLHRCPVCDTTWRLRMVNGQPEWGQL